MPTLNLGAPSTSGYWSELNGAWTSGTPSIGRDSSNRYRSAGLRWGSLAIPQGATITSASLTLTVSADSRNGNATGFHQVDNAPALATGQVSTANSPTVSSPQLTAGTHTLNLTSSLQALINRAGWASGNAAVIRVQGNRFADTWANLTGISLTIEYVDPVPPDGGGDVGVLVALAGSGAAPVVPDAEGSAAATFGVGVAGAGSAPRGGAGSVGPVVVTLSGSGHAPRSEAHAVVDVGLAGSGRTDREATSADAGVALELSGEGVAPYIPPGMADAHAEVVVALAGSGGRVSATDAAAGVELAVAGSGARESASSSASCGVELVLSGLGRVPALEPPPPWQEFVASREFQVLMSGTPTIDFRAEVIDRDGMFIRDVEITDGAVTIDREQPSRRRATVEVSDMSLFPRTPTAPLAKAAQNRVRVWFRVLRGPGRWGEIPLATVYPEDPSASHYATADPTFSLSGADAVSTIPPYLDLVDVSGLRADEAIERILRTVAPWIPLALTPSPYFLPARFEAGVPGADPWTDIEAIARAAGTEVFVDRMGVLVMRPLPTGLDVVADWTEDVVGGLEVEPSREYCNIVRVVSANPEVDPQIVAIARDEDPSSPLNVLDPLNLTYVVNLASGIIDDQGQAQSYADNELVRRQEGMDHVKGVAMIDPAREPGDVVLLDDDVTGRAGLHRLVLLNIPLNADAFMGFEATGARSW